MKTPQAELPAEKYLVYLRRDPVTQVVVEEGWYASESRDPARHPPFHRLDGPAAIFRDPMTGAVIQESWYREGRLHREDGPAITYRTAEGRTTKREWFQNGEQIPHRKFPKAIAQPKPPVLKP